MKINKIIYAKDFVIDSNLDLVIEAKDFVIGELSKEVEKHAKNGIVYAKDFVIIDRQSKYGLNLL